MKLRPCFLILRQGLSFGSRWSARGKALKVHYPCPYPEFEDPEYFDKEAAKLQLGPDYFDELSAIYEQKVAYSRDLNMKRDDSLVQHDSRYWLPEVDPMTPKLGFENISELETAPDSVKRIFSVQYGERKDLTNLWKKRILERVQRDELDATSLEAKIAKQTALIRHWTMLIDHFASYTPRKPRWLHKLLYHSVFHRRKLLRHLRQQNEEAFKRVLKELKIAYYVPNLPEDEPKHTRKGWMEHQIRKKAEQMKADKLDEFRGTLETQQEAFADEKKRRLAELEQEEAQIRHDLAQIRMADDDAVHRYQPRTVDALSEELMHRHYYMGRSPAFS